MPWENIRETSEAGISAYILKLMRGERARSLRGEMNRSIVPTIAELRATRTPMLGECHSCGWSHPVDIFDQRLSPGLTVAEAGSRFRCRDCNQRRFVLVPDEEETCAS